MKLDEMLIQFGDAIFEAEAIARLPVLRNGAKERIDQLLKKLAPLLRAFWKRFPVMPAGTDKSFQDLIQGAVKEIQKASREGNLETVRVYINHTLPVILEGYKHRTQMAIKESQSKK